MYSEFSWSFFMSNVAITGRRNAGPRGLAGSAYFYFFTADQGPDDLPTIHVPRIVFLSN